MTSRYPGGRAGKSGRRSALPNFILLDSKFPSGQPRDGRTRAGEGCLLGVCVRSRMDLGKWGARGAAFLKGARRQVPALSFLFACLHVHPVRACGGQLQRGETYPQSTASIWPQLPGAKIGTSFGVRAVLLFIDFI